MKKRGYYKLIAAVLCAAVLLGVCGCGRKTDAGTTDNGAPPVPSNEITGGIPQTHKTAAEPDKLFTLRFTPGESINPMHCDDVYNDAVSSLMYEGLFRLDESFQPQNVLCESYETMDGKTFNFTIADVKLHDGTALTAEDVAYSINFARNSTKYYARLKNITGCAPLEDGRVQVTLERCNYALPALLDIPIIKDGSGSDDVPPGTGPYKYIKAGNFYVLRAFDGYRSAEALPFEMIYLKEFADDNIVESFADFSLDLIWADTGADGSVNLHSDHESRLYDTAVLQYIGFNSSSTVMNDANVRRAISAAVNREYIVNTIFGGSGRPATLILNPAYYLYNTAWEAGCGYSPAQLSANLAKSGLADKDSDGFLEYPVSGAYQSFTIRFIVNSENKKKVEAAESIAENLRRVGLNVELRELGWNDFKSALNSGSFDMYYGEASLTRDFDFSVLMGSSGSLDYGGMGGSSLDALCRAFSSAETDEAKAEAAKALCVSAAESAVIVPVMYRQYVIYTHRGVIEGFSPSVSGVLLDIAEWKVNMP